jgi:type IV pilus assembly protein PilO
MRFGFRELIFIALIIGLATASGFVLKKSVDKKDRLAKEVESRKKELNDLKQATAGIEDVGRKTAELKQAIQFFESKLPQEKEIDKILKEVWQTAEANALQIRTVKTLRAEKAANYSEQPIEMTLAGDFNGFYSFLLQLEKLPRITRITQMNLSKMSEREGMMQARLTISIFFEPDTGGGRMAATN